MKINKRSLRNLILYFPCAFFTIITCLSLADAPQTMIILDEKLLLVNIDTKSCRWSACLKGTDIRLNNVYFLEGDNPEGWTITTAVNRNDTNPLGYFESVVLHGTKKGQLDFDYRISVSKTGNDIIVSLGRTNHTGAPVEITDMDYFVTDDARLGGTTDKWLTFGTHSRWEPYYDLSLVRNLTSKKRNEVCYLARNPDNGQTILMGHLTVQKGHSRFEISGTNSIDTLTSMWIRAYCNYKVTMPDNRSFEGEKLLLNLSDDALRGLEHLGDLIGIANKVDLKKKRPLNFDDTTMISLTNSAWSSWCSGGTEEVAGKFVKQYRLDKFYYGVSSPDFGAYEQWGLYYCGGRGDYSSGTSFPEACYLHLKVPWGSNEVLDFSNPLSVKMERERVAKALKGNEKKINMGGLDFAQDWDKWPGQHDPYMSALETWHAGAAPWRDAVDSIAPRMRNFACISRPDFNYGYADLQRMERDADCGYKSPTGGTFLDDCVPGITTRFFYNTRVFWNDGDNMHIYRYSDPYSPPSMWRRVVPYDEAKVVATFKGFATSSVRPAESFDEEYPEDRIELLKRISPVTTDAAYPVDLFIRKPASVWNMPIERPFGKWCVLTVFNYGPESPDLTVTLDASTDLRLDPDKEYLVYEFWSKKFFGIFKGKFTSRTIHQKDCDVYAIVEKQDRPVLLSTSRNVRQMAFDIRDLGWNPEREELHGVSRAVSGDPYQLRIYVPSGYSFDHAELPAGLTAKTSVEGNLLTIDFTTATDNDVTWSVIFKK
jgi:hypothetical protein